MMLRYINMLFDKVLIEKSNLHMETSLNHRPALVSDFVYNLSSPSSTLNQRERAGDRSFHFPLTPNPYAAGSQNEHATKRTHACLSSPGTLGRSLLGPM